MVASKGRFFCEKEKLKTAELLSENWKKVRNSLGSMKREPGRAEKIKEIIDKTDAAIALLHEAVRSGNEQAILSEAKKVRGLADSAHRIDCVSRSCRMMQAMQDYIDCIKGKVDEKKECKRTDAAKSLVVILKKSRPLVIEQFPKDDAFKIGAINKYYDRLDRAAAELKVAVDASDEGAIESALHTIAQWQNSALADILQGLDGVAAKTSDQTTEKKSARRQ